VSGDIFRQTGSLGALSHLASHAAREGAAPASLGTPCRCLATLTVKIFFLICAYMHSYEYR